MLRIGANTVIAAQAGIAGSTEIGKGTKIGGQAGIVGHLRLGDRILKFKPKVESPEIQNLAPRLFGYPAIAITIITCVLMQHSKIYQLYLMK